MKCTCGHMPWNHGWAPYPVAHQPCEVCVKCGGNGKSCCLTPKPCPCPNFEREGAA